MTDISDISETSDTSCFGVHLMVDGYNAPSSPLRDQVRLRAAMLDIVGKLGMHAISDPVVVEVGPMNKKDPGGVSGFLLIAESHLSFHTFPARGFVTIDVYTCQDQLNEADLLKYLQEAFQFQHVETYLVNRGRNYPARNIQE